MASGQKVIIDFAPDGTAKVSAEGYTGGECLTATSPFENMFKATVRERVFVGDDCRKDPGEKVRL